MSTHPTVLLLTLADDNLFHGIHKSLLDQIRLRGILLEARNPSSAQLCLEAGSCQAVLIVYSDPLLSQRSIYRRLRDHLRHYIEHQAGTVIFCGTFSTFVQQHKCANFFKNEWDLEWSFGDYYRSTFKLNSEFMLLMAGQETFDQNNKGLLGEYSQKTLQIKGMDATSSLYVSTEDSQLESMVFPTRNVRDAQQAPVVCQKYGKGVVAWFGDVNAEEGTTKAILAICGLSATNAQMLAVCPASATGVEIRTRALLFCFGCNQPENDEELQFRQCSRCKSAFYCSAEVSTESYFRSK